MLKRIGLQLGFRTDPYLNIGSYVYCAGNPVKLKDTDGRKIVFVTVLRYISTIEVISGEQILVKMGKYIEPM